MYVNATQFSSSLIFLTELSYLLITLPIHESNTVVVVIRSFLGTAMILEFALIFFLHLKPRPVSNIQEKY